MKTDLLVGGDVCTETISRRIVAGVGKELKLLGFAVVKLKS
jgi:hypothetical protein